MKYPNARIFQGNELLVLAVMLFDAGRAFEETFPGSRRRALSPEEATERRTVVTDMVDGARTRIPRDEPFFLLRGQDPWAPTGVVHYGRYAEDRGAAQAYVDSIIGVAVS